MISRLVLAALAFACVVTSARAEMDPRCNGPARYDAMRDADFSGHGVGHACAPQPAGIVGNASWYGSESGSRTASGERFDPSGMTCAMRSYRRGQQRTVIVTVLATGKSAACRVNDHGPAAWTGRVIDVSAGMADTLGFKGRGVVRVSVQ